MKLNAKQIGILSAYIEKALKDNPIPEIPEGEVLKCEALKCEETRPEKWEVQLRKDVNADEQLPTYDELPHRLIDHLIDYLS